ncbi:amidase domain-containing protein [Acidipropionibacterium timonense]|uniref:amidase domain-containing protein n=1 Tax=Acidipropionibacterium timonense TaxID=2161818 RepID=UPI00103064A6
MPRSPCSRRTFLVASAGLGLCALTPQHANASPTSSRLPIQGQTARSDVAAQVEDLVNLVTRSGVSGRERSRNPLDDLRLSSEAIDEVQNWSQFSQRIDQSLRDDGILASDFCVSYASEHVLESSNYKYHLVNLLVEKKLDSGLVWSSSLPILLTFDNRDAVVRYNAIDTDWDSVIAQTNGLVTPSMICLDSPTPVLDLPSTSDSDIERMLRAEHMLGTASVRALGGNGRMAAAAYANKYWNSYNRGYRDFSSNSYGGDCTNFVSQCMRAGGWSDTGSLLDRTNDKAWFYWKVTQSYSWVNVGIFRSFSIKHGRSKLAQNVTQMWHGNVIQVAVNGTWYHSTIVTGRSNNLPLLTYHTNNVHNRPFYSFRESFSRAHPGGLTWALHLT